MDHEPSILIGVPCRLQGGFRPFDVVLAQTLKITPNATVAYAMTGVLPGARNRIVRQARGEGYDYIWWLDDDQPFAPTDLAQLLAHHVDAVVPLSCRRGAPFLPLLYDELAEDHARQHFLSDHEHGLIRVAAAGFAGLLIRTSVFTAMGVDGWFEFVHPPDNFDDYSEDFPFYRKLAAQGVPLYCDLETRFGHAVMAVAYVVKQQGKWVTVLADHEPFVAFPQVAHPLSISGRPPISRVKAS